MAKTPDDEMYGDDDETDLEDILGDDEELHDLVEDDLDSDLSEFDDDDILNEDFAEHEDSEHSDELTEGDLSEDIEEPVQVSDSQQEVEDTDQVETTSEDPADEPENEGSQAVAKPPQTTATSHAESSSIHDLPLTMTVELSRIETSVQNVIDMRPGNLIDLQFDQEGTVDLVVSGKKVGQGELVKLGDTIGVRVLQIGTKAL